MMPCGHSSGHWRRRGPIESNDDMTRVPGVCDECETRIVEMYDRNGDLIERIEP